MTDLPRHTKHTVTRHEWAIGSEYEQNMDAKTFRLGLHRAYKTMEELGVDLEFDDAFKVRAGDGAAVILFVDINSAAEES